jgi:hypothetical protein
MLTSSSLRTLLLSSPTKYPAPPSHGEADPEHVEGEGKAESIYVFDFLIGQ